MRILKQAKLEGVGTFSPGAVVNISSEVAANWVREGKAMFYDGKPFENKMVTPPENKSGALQSISDSETEVVNTKLPPVKAKPKRRKK